MIQTNLSYKFAGYEIKDGFVDVLGRFPDVAADSIEGADDGAADHEADQEADYGSEPDLRSRGLAVRG